MSQHHLTRSLSAIEPVLAARTRRRLLTLAAVGTITLPTSSRAASAPSINATLLDGRDFSTEQTKGKVLLVNFWATWCGPCREEMPAIEAYYQAHRAQGLEVLALSTDELKDETKVREAAQPFSFPVAMLKNAKLMRNKTFRNAKWSPAQRFSANAGRRQGPGMLSGFGRIWRMPVSAVIDREGRLVKQDWFVNPKLDATTLDPVIKSLL